MRRSTREWRSRPSLHRNRSDREHCVAPPCADTHLPTGTPRLVCTLQARRGCIEPRPSLHRARAGSYGQRVACGTPPVLSDGSLASSSCCTSVSRPVVWSTYRIDSATCMCLPWPVRPYAPVRSFHRRRVQRAHGMQDTHRTQNKGEGQRGGRTGTQPKGPKCEAHLRCPNLRELDHSSAATRLSKAIR